jgi:hypothetical protein
MSRPASRPRFLFAVVLTATTLIGVFWIIAAQLRMGFLPREYAMWSARHEMIAECRLAPTVILGDSRAAAGLMPNRMDGVTNLALGGASPIEMYYMAQDILKCPQPPRRVVISLSPEMVLRPSFFWDRTGLYGVLTFDQLEEVRRRSRALRDDSLYTPAKLGDWDAIADNFLHAVRFPSFYTTYIVAELAVGRLRSNRATAAETLRAGGQHGYGTEDGCDSVASDADLAAFVPSPLLQDYFGRLLAAFEARGIAVDFIAVPMNQATYDAMRPAVVAGFQTYLDDLAAAHPNFRVLGSAIRPLDDRYFGDSTHLNQRGAELVSRQVADLLAQSTPADFIGRARPRPQDPPHS